MLMSSALHIMQWFSGCLDAFTSKIRRKICDFYILWIKTKCRLHKTWSDLWNKVVHYVLSFSTASNWFVTLYYYFIWWARDLKTWPLANLAFYYTLYLCCQLSRIERESPAYTLFLLLSHQGYKISCITNLSPSGIQNLPHHECMQVKVQKVCLNVSFSPCW